MHETSDLNLSLILINMFQRIYGKKITWLVSKQTQTELKFEYVWFLIGSQISNILDALWNRFRLLATTRMMGEETEMVSYCWTSLISFDMSLIFTLTKKTHCIYYCYYYSFSIPMNSLSNLYIQVVSFTIMLKVSFVESKTAYLFLL